MSTDEDLSTLYLEAVVTCIFFEYVLGVVSIAARPCINATEGVRLMSVGCP